MPPEQDSRIVQLSPEDGVALDAMLAARRGEGAAPLSPEQAERAVRVEQVLQLLDHDHVEDPPASLVERTLARVNEDRQALRFARQVEALSAPATTFGWYELGALAAALLIMSGLAIPMLSKHRGDADRVACSSGLQAAGAAFHAYAADNQGMLPRYKVAPGHTWYHVGLGLDPDGNATSNSQNLRLIIRRRYIDPRTLSCTGNPNAPKSFSADAIDWKRHDQVPYSYQNMIVRWIPNVERYAHRPLLADKNPLLIILPGKPLVMRTNDFSRSSAAHQGGQNVLRTEGSVAWHTSPDIDDDNIWTPRGVLDEIVGNETPAGPDDSHLTP